MTDCCLGFFKAISDETRQRVFGLLEKGEVQVGEIAKKLKLTQPNVSHHLKVLKECGCVRSRKEGKSVYYSVNKEGMLRCCGGFFDRFKIKIGKK